MSFEDGFGLPNIFQEGKTSNPPVRVFKKKGRKGKGKRSRSNGFEIGLPKRNGRDSMENMQKDSVIQARGTGIDQPKRSLGIETFDKNLPKQPNPLEFQEHDRQEQNPFNMGLELDAGFKQPQVQPQQKRNPLNVGLQVGNLGIDSFDTKSSAFDSRTIDVGIGATPKPRSALGGAANLGVGFIARTRGLERTGLDGGGKQDFLRVSGKSFAGVPQILGSQEPTVSGARATARSRALARLGLGGEEKGTPQLNPLKGIQSLAGQLGRSSAAITLRDEKEGTRGFARQQAIRGKIGAGLARGTGEKDRDFNPFNIRGRRRVAQREEEQLSSVNETDGFSDGFNETDEAFERKQRQQDFEQEFEQTRESAKQRRKQAREQAQRDKEQAQRDQDFKQASQGFADEVIKQKIIRQRGIEDKGIPIPRDPKVRVVQETKKQREQRLRNKIQTPKVRAGKRLPSNIMPFDQQFDTDGDGDIEELQGKFPRGSSGTGTGRIPVTKRPTSKKTLQGGFASKGEVQEELDASNELAKIFVKKSRPNLTIGELNETDKIEDLDLKKGETLDTVVSDRDFLDAGLNDQLPDKLQREFNRKMKRNKNTDDELDDVIREDGKPVTKGRAREILSNQRDRRIEAVRNSPNMTANEKRKAIDELKRMRF